MFYLTNEYNNNFREIKDLNKLVLDKDYVVKECQDQLGHFLQKDYDNARVSIFGDNLRQQDILCKASD